MAIPPVSHDPHGEREGLTQGRLVPYAEVLRDDHPPAMLYAAGKTQKPPGRLLRDYINETGGVYEFKMPIGDRLKQQMIQLGTHTGDQELLAQAQLESIAISLEHLKSYDPDTTRIVCGLRLQYTEEEARALKLYDPNPPSPEERESGIVWRGN